MRHSWAGVQPGRMHRALPPLVTLALAACAAVPATPPGPTARFGQVAAVDGLRIQPLEIVEDSRCPADAVCVWAGRLIVRAAISGPSWRETRDLTLGEPLALRGTSIALTAVEPAKTTGTRPTPPLYRFTFASGR